jgi:hypothetical protein
MPLKPKTIMSGIAAGDSRRPVLDAAFGSSIPPRGQRQPPRGGHDRADEISSRIIQWRGGYILTIA